MNTNQRVVVICLFVVVLLLSGCGPGQILGPTLAPTPTDTLTTRPTPTDTPTLTSTPTLTLTPTLTPAGSVASIVASGSTDTPNPEEDFALDLLNTITELNILNIHNQNFRSSFLQENEELSRAEEDFKELNRFYSEPDPDIIRFFQLLADLEALTGIQFTEKDSKIVNQEKYDRFIDFMTFEALYNAVASSTLALNLLVGTNPFSLPGHNLSNEVLTHVFDPTRVKIKEALRDGVWSEKDQKDLGFKQEDALKWANSFNQYLGEIEKAIEKGQSHPDQITCDDLIELIGFQGRLKEALEGQIGLEYFNPKVEKVKGTDQLNVTIEEGKAGLLQNLSFRLEENGVSEKEHEGKKFVVVRIGNSAYVWKIIDEGNYNLVKRIQAKIHSGE